MESEILTGRKLNEAKKNTTDEAVEEILRSAQEQLNRDMNSLNRQGNKPEDKAAMEKKAREKEQRERLIREQEERIQKANQERLKKEKKEQEKLKKEQEQKLAQEKLRKEREEKAAQEKLKKEQEDKARQDKLKKEQELREAQEKLRKEKEEKAEQERIKREQEKRAAQEKLKKEQEEKAEQERIKKEQEQRAAQEKAEREKFVKEQAEKERVGKELAAYDKNSDVKSQNEQNSGADNSANQEQIIEIQGNTQRIDIQVVNEAAEKTAGEKEAAKEIAAAIEADDDVFVETNVPTPIRRKEGLTVGDVIGGFFEFVWTLFKLAVVVSIVTAITGFFLSREMLIRGRNGNLRCLENMPVSEVVATNIDAGKADIKEWLRNVKYQKLTLESDDGYILIAREMIINKDSDKWAVVLHGYNGNMEDVYDIAKKYASKGYNILLPDLRASGESEGSFIGMGWLDRLDVINWIDVVINDHPDAEIVIHGVDMGADTGLMISGEPIKSNIKAIVAEGAYTSAWDVMKKEFKKRHVDWPVFPLMEMVNPVAKIWGGYTLKEANAVKQVEKASVPILLIQGGKDTYVTADMASELNTATASSHKLVTIPSGTHGDCRYADPEMYYGEVFDFLELYIN